MTIGAWGPVSSLPVSAVPNLETVPVTPPTTDTGWGSGAKHRKAMYPGGWIPERLYTPPRKKLKKKALAELKELYEDARVSIPEALQVGLVPPEILLRPRASIALPPVAEVDFEALARSLETIRVLIAAVDAARKAEEEKRKRRRAEEEKLLIMLMEIL